MVTASQVTPGQEERTSEAPMVNEEKSEMLRAVEALEDIAAHLESISNEFEKFNDMLEEASFNCSGSSSRMARVFRTSQVDG